MARIDGATPGQRRFNGWGNGWGNARSTPRQRGGDTLPLYPSALHPPSGAGCTHTMKGCRNRALAAPWHQHHRLAWPGSAPGPPFELARPGRPGAALNFTPKPDHQINHLEKSQ